MTDKEKIRKEVERLMSDLIQEKEKGYGSDVDDACILELQNLLTFIDSLQEEPASNDIEVEFVLYLKYKFNIPQEGNTLKTDRWSPSPYDLLDIAKHFAQWQKEQMITKACEWLRENKDHPLIGCEDPCLSGYLTDEFIKEFKKAMEE